MTSGYYCTIFPFCENKKTQKKKKDDKKTKAFYDWATTGIPVIILIIINKIYNEKADWSRAFNQYAIVCEVDMIKCNI